MDPTKAGLIGELLVEFVPEFRETVEQLVADETGYRERNGVGLADLTAFQLFSEFGEKVLKPALAGLPETRDLVVRCGRAMLTVLKIEGSLGEFHREALGLRLTERLTPDEWQGPLAVQPEAAPLQSF
jgi:hypothetical protein